MNKCLNCGKEVLNKYCDVHCQNKHRQILNKNNYLFNPKKCAYCGVTLPYEKKRNKYCSHSCAAKVNNKNYSKKYKKSLVYANLDNILTYHDDELVNIFNMSKNMTNFVHKIGINGRLTEALKKYLNTRLHSLGLNINDLKNKKGNLSRYRTKKDLFGNRKNWQSARSYIRKDAAIVYEKENGDMCCVLCGYDKHIEICHIKSVSSFGDNAMICEINHVDNLVALCPNHHWEFDNGLISLDNLF